MALVLNLETKNISPQYHLVFDDNFETVQPDCKKIQELWDELLRDSREQVVNPSDFNSQRQTTVVNDRDEFTHSIDVTSCHQPSVLQREIPSRSTESKNRQGSRGVYLVKTPAPDDKSPLSPAAPAKKDNEETSSSNVEPTNLFEEKPSEQGNKGPPTDTMSQRVTETASQRENPPLRRSKRLQDLDSRPAEPTPTDESVTYKQVMSNIRGALRKPASALTALFNQYKDRNGFDHPFACLANRDSDQPTVYEAIKTSQADLWIDAMKLEVEQLEGHKTWETVSKDSMPKDSTLLKSTWALKLKRLPDGLVLKCKARLCACGDLQIKGVNCWDTYSPVVSWPVVRILFSFSLLCGWTTRHIDFSNAFVQADLDQPIYMEIPFGFKCPND